MRGKGLWIRNQGLRVRVVYSFHGGLRDQQQVWVQPWGSGFRVFGFRTQGLGFRGQGCVFLPPCSVAPRLGFRVLGFQDTMAGWKGPTS